MGGPFTGLSHNEKAIHALVYMLFCIALFLYTCTTCKNVFFGFYVLYFYISQIS